MAAKEAAGEFTLGQEKVNDRPHSATSEANSAVI